jgi:dipeptidyl aminopeptidase/acylaminoacyl peptidase
MRYVRALLVLALMATGAPVAAQETGKRPLTQADYDIWNSIQGSSLSNDGQWVAYTVQPLVGEGELVVRSTRSGREYRHSRGYTGREPTSAAGGPGEEGGGGGGGGVGAAQFTADSRFVLFVVQPSREEVESAAAEGRRGNAAPRPALMILSLADGAVTRVDGVRSFSLADENGRFVTYSAPAEPAAPAADSARAGGAAAQRPAAGQGAQAQEGGAAAQRRRTYGTTLVLRDLHDGTETRIDDVLASRFNRAGSVLAFTVASRESERDGVYLRALPAGTVTPVMTGLGNYRQLSWDRDGAQIAFISDRDEYDNETPRFTLYHATVRAPRAQAIVTSDVVGAAGTGNTVADRGSVSFTRDGSAITFAIAPPPVPQIPADSMRDKAVFDLWHWQDPFLQSQQRNTATRDRNATYTGIYHVSSRRFVQLTNDSIPSVSLSENGRIGVANTNVRYRVEAMWGGGATDTYIVDATTGRMTKLREAARGGASLSPGARFLTWFEDGRWHAHNLASGRTVDLTGHMDVRFDRETHSTPSTPPSWGIAGWTPNDASVLVYDMYDIWELDPTGSRAPRMVTDSVGRRNGITFRVVNLEREERFIDPSKPLLLRAVDEQTRASGFWQDRLGVVAPPTRIMMADRNVGTPSKARDADQFVLTKSTFQEFPDLWTGTSLDQLTRISNANPQQSEFRWGTVEMVEWRNMDGVPNRGLLYKPEDFDPSQKYPMVVYFYDTHSPNLHSYSTPTGRNIINAPVYVSKGYLVFMPDIIYTDGYPGPSAVKSIVPGVQYLISQGFVKEDGVGIQGQSWGGYQTTYIITQSNLFRAAMAGAPVANMTSAYGGIRWESGNSRTSQYEFGQSRIGGSLWEFPTRYIENSPLFFADRIQTPLLMMHNDEDGAVPWEQGLEMFIAMRRLGKEVYLLNYNGDAHNPRRRANQRDMDIKMQQFFDHHLTGAPMPDWMKDGIPFLRRGSDQFPTVVTEPPQVTTTSSNGGGR